jgi:hypothetical protein
MAGEDVVAAARSKAQLRVSQMFRKARLARGFRLQPIAQVEQVWGGPYNVVSKLENRPADNKEMLAALRYLRLVGVQPNEFSALMPTLEQLANRPDVVRQRLRDLVEQHGDGASEFVADEVEVLAFDALTALKTFANRSAISPVLLGPRMGSPEQRVSKFLTRTKPGGEVNYYFRLAVALDVDPNDLFKLRQLVELDLPVERVMTDHGMVEASGKFAGRAYQLAALCLLDDANRTEVERALAVQYRSGKPAFFTAELEGMSPARRRPLAALALMTLDRCLRAPTSSRLFDSDERPLPLDEKTQRQAEQSIEVRKAHVAPEVVEGSHGVPSASPAGPLRKLDSAVWTKGRRTRQNGTDQRPYHWQSPVSGASQQTDFSDPISQSVLACMTECIDAVRRVRHRAYVPTVDIKAVFAGSGAVSLIENKSAHDRKASTLLHYATVAGIEEQDYPDMLERLAWLFDHPEIVRRRVHAKAQTPGMRAELKEQATNYSRRIGVGLRQLTEEAGIGYYPLAERLSVLGPTVSQFFKQASSGGHTLSRQMRTGVALGLEPARVFALPGAMALELRVPNVVWLDRRGFDDLSINHFTRLNLASPAFRASNDETFRRGRAVGRVLDVFNERRFLKTVKLEDLPRLAAQSLLTLAESGVEVENGLFLKAYDFVHSHAELRNGVEDLRADGGRPLAFHDAPGTYNPPGIMRRSELLAL